MTSVVRADVEKAIREYIDPYLQADLLAAKSVKDIRIDGGKVEIDVELGFPSKSHHAVVVAALKGEVDEIPGVTSITVKVTQKVVAHSVQKGLKPLPNVKNVIAVASGKGGVGKSTTSVNLALALAVEGATVGILDADIYGPSQPRMLGSMQTPDTKDGKSLEPVVSHGIQSMSIGYLIDDDTPMIWRGPMVTQALEQLLRDTQWKDLDYLIIDLPPGTGDIQLTLSQKVPVSGAIIVTTPQDIALLDAVKGLKMFEKVQVTVLGVIENMSTHICSQCGHEEHIFGEGGGGRMAEASQVDLLGQLPLDIRIRREADAGKPTVAVDPDGSIGMIYREIAMRASAKLSQQAKSYSQLFPNIVIENS